MKNFLILSSLLLLAACAEEKPRGGQEARDGLLSTDLVSNPHSAKGLDTAAYNDMPTMDFADTVHNFGSLEEGIKASYAFEFTNNGNTPLIISGADGSCGCAVADYPRDPVVPGGSGFIQVVFDTDGKSGHQEKSIAITTNAQRSIRMLYIKADVGSAEN